MKLLDLDSDGNRLFMSREACDSLRSSETDMEAKRQIIDAEAFCARALTQSENLLTLLKRQSCSGKVTKVAKAEMAGNIICSLAKAVTAASRVALETKKATYGVSVSSNYVDEAASSASKYSQDVDAAFKAAEALSEAEKAVISQAPFPVEVSPYVSPDGVMLYKHKIEESSANLIKKGAPEKETNGERSSIAPEMAKTIEVVPKSKTHFKYGSRADREIGNSTEKGLLVEDDTRRAKDTASDESFSKVEMRTMRSRDKGESKSTGKSVSEIVEQRRSSRKIIHTSKFLEGLETVKAKNKPMPKEISAVDAEALVDTAVNLRKSFAELIELQNGFQLAEDIQGKIVYAGHLKKASISVLETARAVLKVSVRVASKSKSAVPVLAASVASGNAQDNDAVTRTSEEEVAEFLMQLGGEDVSQEAPSPNEDDTPQAKRLKSKASQKYGNQKGDTSLGLPVFTGVAEGRKERSVAGKMLSTQVSKTNYSQSVNIEEDLAPLASEPRRSNRKGQPTFKLLESLEALEDKVIPSSPGLH